MWTTSGRTERSYVRRIKKILEEYKNALAAEKAADEDSDVLVRVHLPTFSQLSLGLKCANA